MQNIIDSDLVKSNLEVGSIAHKRAVALFYGSTHEVTPGARTIINCLINDEDKLITIINTQCAMIDELQLKYERLKHEVAIEKLKVNGRFIDN